MANCKKIYIRNLFIDKKVSERRIIWYNESNKKSKHFNLFKYDFRDPSNKMPTGEIDLDEVHAKLGQ